LNFEGRPALNSHRCDSGGLRFLRVLRIHFQHIVLYGRYVNQEYSLPSLYDVLQLILVLDARLSALHP